MTEIQVRQDVSVPVQLAASVLFGDEFLEAADKRFLEFIQEDPRRWGRLMLATWSTIADASGSPSPQPPARQLTPSAAPEAQKKTAPGVPVGPTAEAAPAETGASNDGKPTSTPQTGSSIDFFDPDEEESPQLGKRPASLEEIKARLVELVAEVSGYPPEIFEEHLDLEVDLGIDSIKQVQTLAKLREEYDLPMDEGFLMKDYATIGKIADYISTRVESES
ncbi:phosphopantetheine-binding protein [Streptomyces sp. NPDC004647]|uniref:acyl carrier protein n=1 Tax=Streptomyces sp. NPDC004647 TaxID=3154671 RepID=UPI0033B6F50F